MPTSKKAEKSVAGYWIPDVCTKADLSVLLGISIRALADLDNKGVLVRAPKRGTYRTRASVLAYIERLREVAAGRSADQRSPLNEERLLTERVSRQIQEAKLAQIRGEVLSLEEVSESWSNFASIVRSAMLALPGKARTQIPHLTAHDAETIRTIVKDTLNDMADEVSASVIAGEASDVGKK